MMDRRKFLKSGSLVTGGAMLSPALLKNCTPIYPLMEIKFNGHVIIIGAGAAGLAAGLTLKENGEQITILEASDKIGGRVRKLSGFSDIDLDLGGEWIHGHKTDVSRWIMDKANFEVFKDKSDSQFWFKGKLVTKLPDNIFKLEKNEES